MNKSRIISALCLIALVVILFHNVPSRITKKDKASIELFISDMEIDKELIQNDYNYQIKILSLINKKVLKNIKNSSQGIPLGESREPSNQINLGYGQCFDRSRLIEKTCKYLGFNTRHLYIVKNENYNSTIRKLISSSTLSHATSEVKTLKGWLIIDSNFEWISLSNDSLPVGFNEIKSANLLSPPVGNVNPFYLSNTQSIYGLYSRHGRFYYPYNPIPDYNIRELLYNF